MMLRGAQISQMSLSVGIEQMCHFRGGSETGFDNTRQVRNKILGGCFPVSYVLYSTGSYR